ncbi:hypothetical protein Tco_0216687 [Tanacetum coccineum]
MVKAFKRLVKFGRKSRYTDNLSDYISAITSKGDDESEVVSVTKSGFDPADSKAPASGARTVNATDTPVYLTPS